MTTNIKIKTLDMRDLEIQVEKTILISDLKSEIESKFDIVKDHQRLIYHGRILNNDKSVEECGIKDYCTIHMVIRKKEEVPECLQNQTQNVNAPPPVTPTRATRNDVDELVVSPTTLLRYILSNYGNSNVEIEVEEEDENNSNQIGEEENVDLNDTSSTILEIEFVEQIEDNTNPDIAMEPMSPLSCSDSEIDLTLTPSPTRFNRRRIRHRAPRNSPIPMSPRMRELLNESITSVSDSMIMKEIRTNEQKEIGLTLVMYLFAVSVVTLCAMFFWGVFVIVPVICLIALNEIRWGWEKKRMEGYYDIV